jgi:outer membrane receptor protein involved in Fe transport
MSRNAIFSLGVVCFLLFLAGNVFSAETTANIIGTITDSNNAPLPGATVTAVNTATNFTRTTTSEESGTYRVALLPPGTYTVTVELGGFARQVHKEIILTLGKEIVLDFQLKLATAEEQLEVVGETPLIDATKSAIEQTVDQTAIKSLPLNGRDYTQLSLLAPGVKPVTLTNYGQFQIGGQRGDAVNYTIDGGENNFSYTNEARTLFTQEGVKEFQILTNRFSAEYGRSTSGVINVISKSGTNDFHGNGFLFFRPFDEENFFAKERGVKTPFDQEQGGGTLGGPIIRDKTFFFFAYENTNTDKSLLVAITPAQTSFPSGIRPKPVDLQLLTAKVDHTLNEQHSMVFRYNLQDRSESGFYAGGRYVDTVQQDILSQTLAVSETAVFSNNTYNEALVQYGRFLRHDDPEVTSKPWDWRPGSVTGFYYCCPQRFLEDRIELLDTYTHVFNKHGEHTMKAGVDYIHIGSEIKFEQYIGGAYFFATDDPFDPNNPDTFPTFYIEGAGNANTEATNHQFSVFLQDDWRVNDRLTLNLGLRYDIEKFDSANETPTPIPGSDVILGKIPPVDKNNFGPRLGFTFDPWGKGETIIRGGYGRYFKPILHNVYNNAILFDQIGYEIKQFADVDTMLRFFPNNIPFELLDIPADIRPMASADVAYTDQTSIGFQQELQKDFVVSVDYVYIHGNNLTRERNLNAPRNLVNPEDPPFPQFGRFRLLTTDAESWYHGLQIGMQKRYSRNFMFTASYTLSKAEDEASDFYIVAEPNDQFNPDAEKGPGPHDQRHVFAFSAIYDLPAQFQIGSIVRAASGIPINFVLNENHNHDGVFGNDRPDLGPNGEFVEPPPDRPGNLPRNFGRGDNYFTVDLRLAKNFNWGKYRLELIGEVFNLFDTVNFNSRGATVNRYIDLSDPTSIDRLGEASEVFDPRQVQFGIKFDF